MPEILAKTDALANGKIVFIDAPAASALVQDMRKAKQREHVESEVRRQQRQEKIEQRDELQITINRMTRQSVAGEFLKEHNAEIAALTAEFEPIKAEIASWNPNTPTSKLTGTEKHRARIIASLNGPAPESWLASLAQYARFADAPATPGKMKLPQIQKRKTEILDAMIDLQATPLDLAAVEARIDQDIADAARGPILTGALNFRDQGGGSIRQGHITFPITIDESQLNEGIALACWAMGPQIAERLKAEARERMAGVNGIGVEERKRRDADLRAEYLTLQRLEVRVCRENFEAVPATNPLAFFEVECLADAPIPINQNRHEEVDLPPGTLLTEDIAQPYSRVPDDMQNLIPKEYRKVAAEE